MGKTKRNLNECELNLGILFKTKIKERTIEKGNMMQQKDIVKN